MGMCIVGCQCGRHTARSNPNHPQNSPEYRSKVSQQMKAEWQKRHEDPELMESVSANISRGHEGYWTPERRAQVTVAHLHQPEIWARAAEARRGKSNGQPAVGYSLNPVGYLDLHMQQGHPLARSGGLLGEHRKVLYDKIGPGPHLCYWDCGKLLDWGGLSGIVADHIDGDKLNNDPANLVPSCSPCNTARRIEGGT